MTRTYWVILHGLLFLGLDFALTNLFCYAASAAMSSHRPFINLTHNDATPPDHLTPLQVDTTNNWFFYQFPNGNFLMFILGEGVFFYPQLEHSLQPKNVTSYQYQQVENLRKPERLLNIDSDFTHAQFFQNVFLTEAETEVGTKTENDPPPQWQITPPQYQHTGNIYSALIHFTNQRFPFVIIETDHQLYFLDQDGQAIPLTLPDKIYATTSLQLNEVGRQPSSLIWRLQYLPAEEGIFGLLTLQLKGTTKKGNPKEISFLISPEGKLSTTQKKPQPTNCHQVLQ